MSNRLIHLMIEDCIIRSAEQTVGASGACNALTLLLEFDERWEGTTKTVYFRDANGGNAVSVTLGLDDLTEDGAYAVVIPAEPLAIPGMATMTVRGVVIDGETVTRSITTQAAAFRVLDADIPDSAGNAGTITASDKEQLQAEIDALETIFTTNKVAAETAAATATTKAAEAGSSAVAAAGSEQAAANSAVDAAARAGEAAQASATSAESANAAFARADEATGSAAAASASAAAAAVSEGAAAVSAQAASEKASAAAASSINASEQAFYTNARAIDAAKYSATAATKASEAAAAATAADESAQSAAASAQSAATKAGVAADSATAAAASSAAADSSAAAAAASETAAANSAQRADERSVSAQMSKERAIQAADEAYASKVAAAGIAAAADESAQNAAGSATAAEKSAAAAAVSDQSAAETAAAFDANAQAKTAAFDTNAATKQAAVDAAAAAAAKSAAEAAEIVGGDFATKAQAQEYAAAAQAAAIAQDIKLGETAQSAYRGDRGKQAYDHIADAVKHVTAAERTSWNGKAAGSHNHTKSQITDFPTAMTPTAHTHTVSDLTSIVPISKGGTGATTAAAARTNLGVQAALTFDTAPTAGSSNPVTSGGIKTALDGKAAGSHTHATGDVTGLTSSLTEKQDKTDNTLSTANKTVVGAINEVFTSASNGKTAVAAAITGKGVPTAATDSYETMAGNITAIPVLDTSDATATANDLIAGKTAYAKGSKITGAIPSKGAATITPATYNQTIGSGNYIAGTQTILGDSDLVTGNIRAGVNIFGVNGKASVVETNDATATAGDVITGKTAYVNGVKLIGSYVQPYDCFYCEIIADTVNLRQLEVENLFVNKNNLPIKAFGISMVNYIGGEIFGVFDNKGYFYSLSNIPVTVAETESKITLNCDGYFRNINKFLFLKER